MTAHAPHATPARSTRAKPSSPHRWSQEVTENSDAMDLPQDVFKLTDPKKIAQALKRSAEHSDRRKSDPYRSAMSMITFYINRAGENLAARQRKHLEDAKDELRALFDRPAAKPRKAAAAETTSKTTSKTTPKPTTKRTTKPTTKPTARTAAGSTARRSAG